VLVDTAANNPVHASKAPDIPPSCGEQVYEYFAPGSLVVWRLDAREKKASLKLEHVSLAQVLESLAAATGVMIENHTTMQDVSAVYRREKLEDVLFDLADRYGIVYEVPGPDRLRVFDTIKPPVASVKIRPEYPLEARTKVIRGKVMLTTVICTDGTIGWMQVLKSPSPLLSEAALAAVRQWKYVPATRDGTPIAVYMTIVVEFTA
jgi:TonB family protein